MKGLVCKLTTFSRYRVSKMTATLELPSDLQGSQRLMYEKDFRRKMSSLGLYLQIYTDRPTSNDDGISFTLGHKTVSFNVGLDVTTNGETAGILKKIKLFFDAYCCLYNFQWTFMDTVHTPDYSRRAAASALWANVEPVVLRL
jgi:hypothetical protein